MKKKICLIAPSNSIHTLKHIDILKKLKYDIYYIAIRDEWKPIEKTTFIPLNQKLPYKIALFFAWEKIIREIRKIKPDLIHIHYLTPFGLFFLGSRVKTVISFWGSDIRITYRKSSFPMKYLYNYAIKRADYITIPGNYLLELIPFGIKKVEETIWGINTDNVVERNNNDKTKWGGATNETVITSLRINRDIFQIERLIKAVDNLINKKEKIELNIIEGPYTEYNKKIRKQCKDKKHIHIYKLLKNEEFHSLLRASDIGISMALTDAGPVSVKEAMAIGLPIIFQDIFGIDRTIQNGITGIGLNNLSIGLLEEKIIDLMKNKELYRKISDNAKIYAMQNFDQKKYENKLKHIYEYLLK